MKKLAIVTILLAFTWTASAAEAVKRDAPAAKKPGHTDQQIKAEFNRVSRSINNLDNNPAALNAALAFIAKETDVPVNLLRAQRNDHEGVGTAGIFLANELAKYTKKPSRHWFEQHDNGKSWESLIEQAGFKWAQLMPKLETMEKNMKAAANK